jgi:hypothetical protein
MVSLLAASCSPFSFAHGENVHMRYLAILLAVPSMLIGHSVSRSDDVALTVDVAKLPDNRVRLSGTTNLPPGTKLILTVSEKSKNGFGGQSSCNVSEAGTYSSEAFGPKGGLEDGRYIAEAMMPIPQVQPPAVQAVIGEKGQRLSGALVNRIAVGVTVKHQVEFSIGDAPDAAQAARATEVEAETAKLKRELCVLLEELLAFKDEARFKEVGFGVGGPYNQWLKRVEVLQKAQPVGVHPIPILLRAAPGDLMMVGMKYMSSGECDFTRQMVPELKVTIGYAEYVAAKEVKPAASNPFRLWRDSRGETMAHAQLVSVSDKAIVLRKRDGKTLTVPFTRLSKEDLTYLEGKREEK